MEENFISSDEILSFSLETSLPVNSEMIMKLCNELGPEIIGMKALINNRRGLELLQFDGKNLINSLSVHIKSSSSRIVVFCCIEDREELYKLFHQYF